MFISAVYRNRTFLKLRILYSFSVSIREKHDVLLPFYKAAG